MTQVYINSKGTEFHTMRSQRTNEICLLDFTLPENCMFCVIKDTFLANMDCRLEIKMVRSKVKMMYIALKFVIKTHIT